MTLMPGMYFAMGIQVLQLVFAVKKLSMTFTRADKKLKRRQLIQQAIDFRQATILEIGAFDNPTFMRHEANVYYCDYFCKKELVKQYGKSRPERVNNAVNVDYVTKDINFQRHIEQKFDLIVANHVLEHTPNMIGWLQNLSLILKENGLLFLSVPHKEYTFDKLRSSTSAWELIRNFEQNLQAPSIYQVADQLYYHRPIKAKDVWQKKYQSLTNKKRFNNIKQAFERAKNKINKDKYVDTHCNVFTYKSFIQVFEELNKGNYISLSIVSSSNVEKLDNEFHVLLR